MAKKLFRKFLPHPDVITKNRWIKLLGPRLQEPSLWHINRRSCSMAVALGLFCAFIPVPFQMLIAATLAVVIRANILVAVPMVWISNPVTMGPMFYFCYLIGAEILGLEPKGFDFELSFAWLVNSLEAIWQPFLLGCFTVGAISSLAAFLLVRILWHLHILRHIKLRARRLHNRRRKRPSKQ
ncbi:MAG: DUF2062 domain-containing protein [Gammaproteobacteria bacterium]|nr:DUF2062 domain-containing protein [Gammaproteobacteria bacterium]